MPEGCCMNRIAKETAKWVNDSVDKYAKKANTLADSVFETPELAGFEMKSSQAMIKALSEAGFEVKTPVAGIETAFTASYGHGSPVIGLLAEYDAVSGISQEAGVLEQKSIAGLDSGHACGHNLLGAGCYAAALALKDYLDTNKNTGTVIVFGCPAEESIGGKTFMARSGVFDRVDIALSWHPYDYTTVSASDLQADVWMKYQFKGKSSHAAAAPEAGRSALDAMELMNTGANYLREHVSKDVCFHYAVTDTGGVSPNVVQSSSEVVYLIRAANLKNVKSVADRIDNVARGAALMTDTQVEIEFVTGCSEYRGNTVVGYAVNDSMALLGAPAYTKADRKVAEDYSKTLDNPGTPTIIQPLISRMIKEDPSVSYILTAPLNDIVIPYMPMDVISSSTSDVGDVSKKCPTIMFTVSTCAQGTAGHSWQMISQGKSSLAHTGMLYGAKVMALTAIKFMKDPALVKSAWEEFEETHPDPYICPIPDYISFETARGKK